MIKTCVVCDVEYHVSIYCKRDPYVCPMCAGQYVKPGKHKKKTLSGRQPRQGT